MDTTQVLKFEGSQFFRQRLVCATLSSTPLLIKDIRSNEEKPGLVDYEASLLRLMEKLTNGSKIEIDVTGTSLYYKPGILTGGTLKHDCGITRSIGYFLEVLILLAPFGKSPLKISLTGITNHNDNFDVSVDTFRTVTIPSLKHFGIEGIEFKVTKRGAPPSGGGLVQFSCPTIKSLTPLNLLEPGQIKRVRGIAYTTRASPSIASRMVDIAKGQLLTYIKDVYIYTDHYTGNEAGGSPGYGLTLVAETTTGCMLSAERMGAKAVLPEDVSNECTVTLMHEILRGGCVDTSSQGIFAVLMAIGSEDVQRLRIGKLSPYTIEYLRHIKKFFGVQFQLEAEVESKTVLLTCLGSGFSNLGRKLL